MTAIKKRTWRTGKPPFLTIEPAELQAALVSYVDIVRSRTQPKRTFKRARRLPFFGIQTCRLIPTHCGH
jgi:hypothetical protein